MKEYLIRCVIEVWDSLKDRLLNAVLVVATERAQTYVSPLYMRQIYMREVSKPFS